LFFVFLEKTTIRNVKNRKKTHIAKGRIIKV